MIKNTKRRKQVCPNWCTHSPVGGVDKSPGITAVRDAGHCRTVGARRSGSCQRSPRVRNSWVTSWRMSKRGSRFYLLPSLHTQSYSQYFLQFLSLGTVALGGLTLLRGGAVPCIVDWWAASSASTPETTENVANVSGGHTSSLPLLRITVLIDAVVPAVLFHSFLPWHLCALSSWRNQLFKNSPCTAPQFSFISLSAGLG